MKIQLRASICQAPSGFNFLAALALMGSGLNNISRGVYEIWSLVLSAGGGALLVESVLRLVRLMNGETTGSFLAFLVKPVYYMAIRDNPVPPS